MIKTDLPAESYEQVTVSLEHLSSGDILPERKIVEKKDKARFPSVSEMKVVETRKAKESES